MQAIAWSLVLGVLGVLLAPGVYSEDCNEKIGSKIIKFNPTFISILGNKPITVEGDFLRGATRIQFRFYDVKTITLDGTISDNKANCIAPFFYTNGRIQVDLLITRTTNEIETFTGYIYTTKHTGEVTFNIQSSTSFTMSWDRSKFISGVSLELVLFELSGGVWTPRGVLKDNILNTGSFSGSFTNIGITVMQKIQNVFVIKLIPSQVQNTVTPGGCTVTTHCNGIITGYLYHLGEKTPAELNALCYAWYVQDSGPPKDVLHCPPTLKQAEADTRFEPVDDLRIYNPDADRGFQQRTPSPSGGGQRCTYKNGKLLTTPPSCGSVQSVSPNGKEGMNKHFVADLLPWYTCCVFIKNSTACSLYHDRRPCDDGSHYKPPGHGSACGDPHITTFDGHYYTFNGVGEFWVLKSLENNFVIQARTEQWGKSKASVITSVVMYEIGCGQSARIQLSITDGKFELLLGGKKVFYDTSPNEPKRKIMYNGVSIIISTPKAIQVTFSTGYSISFTQDIGIISLVTLVNPELKGKLKAWLGNYDGDQSNDYTLPNGSTYPINSPDKKIFEYGMQWKIRKEESLFTYAACKNYDSYVRDDFEPTFGPPNLDNIPPEQVAACKGNTQCLFDLAATGQLDVATNTLTSVQEFEALVQANAVTCTRPNVPANGYVQATNYLVGSSVKLVCNDNYKVNGVDTIKCGLNANGQLSWDQSFGTCVMNNKCANPNAWLQWLCEQGLSM